MKRALIGIGGALILMTLIAWYLLSGFGCEMNTAGCRTVRLDFSSHALRLRMRRPRASGDSTGAPGAGVGQHATQEAYSAIV
eukprot:gene14338-biopygen12720